MSALIRRWGPAILCMLVIFLLSGTPRSELPDFSGWDTLAKKGGHLIGYAALAAAYYYALNCGKRPTRRQFFSLAVLMTILYAASDEWHQKFVPGRNSSLIDVCIDTTGGLIGIAAFCLVRKGLRSRQVTADTQTE